MQKNFIEANYDKNDILAKMIMGENGVHTYCYPAPKLSEMQPSINHYMSLNTLMYKDGKIKRDQEHIRRLKFLYMDLDTYHTGYSNHQILMNLEENYFNRIIPVPSYVVASGRGMYLLWRIDEHVNALPRWKKVQEYLYCKLKEFGADRAVVTDSARVFRIPGSVNHKSGQVVEIVRDYSRSYTLYEIQQEFLPRENAQIHDSKVNKRFIPYETGKKFLISRIRDLKYLLLNYRDHEGAFRENILFLYRYYYLCVYGDSQAGLKAALKLNQQLKNPLLDKEVVDATKSAQKYFDDGCSFRMTNATMIDFLDLSDQEIAQMPSLAAKERQKEKKSKYNRRTYIKRLKNEGKDTKTVQIHARRKQVYKLLTHGYLPAEIAQCLGISRATCYADLKIVKKVIKAMKTPLGYQNPEDFERLYQELFPEQENMIRDTEMLEFVSVRNGPVYHCRS